MTVQEAVVLQQLINGLSLGMMYALLALGFTMVYGIIELINFAHFNVFMAGTFFGLWFLAWLGYGRSAAPLSGLNLALVFVGAFAVTMVTTGALGALIERVCLKPLRGVSGTAPMITTIGVSLILQSLILYATNFANNVPFPALIPNERWAVLGGIGNIAGAVLGGLVIGFVESLSGQFIGNSWSDVVIFSILICVLVFRPNGLIGMQRPQRA